MKSTIQGTLRIKNRPAGRKDGFTLIEVMIVVLLISLLAALATPAYKRAREKTKMTLLGNNFRQIWNAAQQYILEGTKTRVKLTDIVAFEDKDGVRHDERARDKNGMLFEYTTLIPCIFGEDYYSVQCVCENATTVSGEIVADKHYETGYLEDEATKILLPMSESTCYFSFETDSGKVMRHDVDQLQRQWSGEKEDLRRGLSTSLDWGAVASMWKNNDNLFGDVLKKWNVDLQERKKILDNWAEELALWSEDGKTPEEIAAHREELAKQKREAKRMEAEENQFVGAGGDLTALEESEY